MVAVEGLLRVIAPVPMMPRYVNAAPYGIRGNIGGRIYRHSTAEYNILIKTNYKGIRAGYEIPYNKPSNIKRVVLLGDSFGMGYGVNADEMFDTRMAHYLKTKYNIAVEVINLATSGHGNAEELIVLLNEGFKYSPDLVLLAWHYTDLDDNVRSKLFKLVDGKLERSAKTYLPGVKSRQFLDQFVVYRILAEHSQIYNFLRNWAGKKIKRLLVQVSSQKTNFKEKEVKKIININKDYKKELTIALLERIKQECSIRNSRFLILDIPFWRTRTKFISKFPNTFPHDSTPFPVVSPIEKFSEKRGAQIYWEKGDGHFTPLGCDLVGEFLADDIRLKQLLGDHSRG